MHLWRHRRDKMSRPCVHPVHNSWAATGAEDYGMSYREYKRAEKGADGVHLFSMIRLHLSTFFTFCWSSVTMHKPNSENIMERSLSPHTVALHQEILVFFTQNNEAFEVLGILTSLIDAYLIPNQRARN